MSAFRDLVDRWDPATWLVWLVLVGVGVPGMLILMATGSATTTKIPLLLGAGIALLVGAAMVGVVVVAVWSVARGHLFSVVPLALAALMVVASALLACVSLWMEFGDFS